MKNQKLKDIYNSRAFWIVISLLASIILWFYITSIENNDIEQTYRGVPVVFLGEDALEEKGLIVSNVETSSVTVVITGPSRELRKFDASDLTAVIDVTKINQPNVNRYAYSIQFPDNVNSKDFSYRYVPDTVTFTVEKESSKSVEIRGVFEGSSAEGFVVESDAMSFDPATITIYGTADALAKISFAQVTIDGQEIDATIHEDRPYMFMNANGEEVDAANVTADVDTVNVTVPVNMLKEVTLEVEAISGGGANRNNCDIHIYPEKITLSGDTEELSNMNKLIVGTIDLSDYEGDFEIVYPLQLGDGIECVTGETEARVSVKFRDLETESFEVTDLRFINRPDGYTASVVNKTLTVKIRSTRETLDKISADDIRVVADLADFGTMTGYVTVPVKIYIDGVTGAGAVGDYSVTVNLTS